MSAQIPESLRYEDALHVMCTNPLDAYLALSGRDPGFQTVSTSLWRGYLGQWEITGKRLYLVGLRGRLRDGRHASLESLFPGYSDRVFAHWFSGLLRLPQGRPLKLIHDGYDTPFERDLLLSIQRGKLIGRKLRINGHIPTLNSPWREPVAPASTFGARDLVDAA